MGIKVGDLTIREYHEICHSRKTCKGCPLVELNDEKSGCKIEYVSCVNDEIDIEEKD